MYKNVSRNGLTLTGLSLLGLAGLPAHAQFIINPTYDSSITSRPDAAAIESTINSAISSYETLITNPGTVNIDFGNINSGLGQSSTTFYTVDYSAYAAALKATATGNTSFLQSVPVQVANPVNGSTTIDATSAQLRTLGFGPTFVGDKNGAFDSFIQINFDTSYNNRIPVAGKFDLFSTVEHEINEALGLSSALDGVKNGDPTPTGSIGSLDLYRYSNTNGTIARSFNTNTPDANSANGQAYLSLDGGTTPLVYFNQVQGGDFHDFASSGEVYDKAPEVQDAFGNPAANSSDFSQQPINGPAELGALHAIGYNFTPNVAVPEPGTFALLIGGLGAGLAFRRKNRK